MRATVQGTAIGKDLVMAGWTIAPDVRFAPFPLQPHPSLAPQWVMEKRSTGPLLISSLGTRSYCVCSGGSSNLNTVTALLMVLALADSTAKPGT